MFSFSPVSIDTSIDCPWSQWRSDPREGGTCFFAFAGSGPSPPEVEEDIVGHTPGNGGISIVLEHRVTRFEQRAATILIEFRAVSISSQKSESL